MIISPQRRYIFVHIPKTGGTSLAAALEARAARDDILIGDTPKALRRRARLAGLSPRGRLWKHSTLADIDGVADLEGQFVFTLVRNPWDRMVSYYHWLRAQTFDHPAVPLAQRLDFPAFTAAPEVRASMRAGQSAAYLTDGAGRYRGDLRARLEVPEDLDPLWRHLGFRLALPRLNASDRSRDWRGYYDEAAAARVAEDHAEDIAAFGYRFDAAHP